MVFVFPVDVVAELSPVGAIPLKNPNVTGFLGATFYPPRSSILIACEFMDLRSFKDVMAVMQASTKGVSCLPSLSESQNTPSPVVC